MKNRKLLLKLVQKSVEQSLVPYGTRQSFEKGKLNESKAKGFIETFKKLNLSEAIFCLETYQKLLKQELSKSQAIVSSASKLSRDEQNKISKRLNTAYFILNTNFQIDPSLLGGIKVKIGDTIFDDTVKSKINTVKEAIRV